jgi:hypothetical protein
VISIQVNSTISTSTPMTNREFQRAVAIVFWALSGAIASLVVLAIVSAIHFLIKFW